MKNLNPFRDQKGQGLIEYALILMLVAVVVIGVFSCFWLALIPFFIATVMPWLTATIAAAQDGSSAAITQLVVAGALFLCCLCCCCGGGAGVRYTRR